MLPILLIFAPGLLSAALYRSLRQNTDSNFDFIVHAIIFSFLIAAFCFGIVYLRGFGDMPPLDVFRNLRSTSKYCVIATLVSIALPNGLFFLAKLLKR